MDKVEGPINRLDFRVEQVPHGVFKKVFFFWEDVQSLWESIDDGIKIFQFFYCI